MSFVAECIDSFDVVASESSLHAVNIARTFACWSAVWALSGLAAEETRVSFAEVARETGVVFQHENGGNGQMRTVEIVGSGVATFDYDGDGRLDIWLVQSGTLDSENTFGDRLFRNVSSHGELAFVDVTEAAGIDATEYGMGVAIADYDGDGDPDVFLANYGPNQLFRNLGDGRFEEVSAAAGVDSSAWSVGASFFDQDGDGRQDLYVANYLAYDHAGHEACYGYSSQKLYCAPHAYPPAPDEFYRNLGDGRFADVSRAVGISDEAERGMGVVARDFDADGRMDVYVANDAGENNLWRNTGDGFRDDALFEGVAVNSFGVAEASMGLAAADYDVDGDLDLFVTHDRKETNTLYVKGGHGYSDRTNRLGLGASSMANTGFGTVWLDADSDGDLDLFSGNGAVRVIESQRGDRAIPLAEPDQLWLQHDGVFEEAAVAAFAEISVARGVARADLDNDGDHDLVVNNNGGLARIYRNDADQDDSAWIGIDVRGANVIGARVRAAGRQFVVQTDGSYASASDPRVLITNVAGAIDVDVGWPDGFVSRHVLPAGRYHVVERFDAGERP